jgi:abhydrolase domain-containing protein 14|uniref:Alpha/beta hydrolase n=1 Tax=candidate division WOR-3 bacterium TaxID=2052148 RepID=A0A7V3RGX8_UNCW3
MTNDRFMVIDGKKVHYLENKVDKAKDTLILLHGKSFNAQTWKTINADDEISGMGINFIAVDYPGWGNSEANERFWPPTEKYDNAAEFIDIFSNQLKLSKFSLLGASFSGPFVVSFASSHPEKINKLIFVGTVWSEALSSDIKQIDKHSLIIFGEKDEVIPPGTSKKYSDSLKSSQLFIVKNARHALYLDKPEEFFQILKGFLLSHLP